MSDADCWLNILEELKEKAETYNAVYQHELPKPRPRISVLIRVWCQHFEGMEVAFWATPSGPQQDAFKAEMRFADEMINKLAAPYLKAFGLEELSDG